MPRLLHVGKDTVFENISGIKLYTFPPGKAVPVEDEYIANVLLDRLHYTGLTRIPESEGPDGIPVFDMKAATRLATERLAAARKEMVEQYIRHQVDTRVNNNLLPLPPAAPVAKIIEEDGWNLEDYGIKLVGSQVGKPMQKQAQKIDEQALEIEKTRSEMASLREMVGALTEQNKLLLEKLGKGK